MAESYTHKWKKLIRGTFFIFLGESLIFPTGLLTVIFLTHRLGPRNFGLYILVWTLISWVEWSIHSIFSRSAVKLIGETEDWASIAAKIVRVDFTIGVFAACLLGVGAGGIGLLLREPEISKYVQLFALEIPLFCLGRAYRSIMVGTGYFYKRALCTSVHFIGRFLLILLFVQLGFSITGVIYAHLVAGLLDLAIIHFFCIPSLLFHPSGLPLRKLLTDSLPLFLFAMCMRFYNKIDLFMLKILGGTTMQAGFYGAAQSLSQGVGILSLSFSPVLISTLSQILRTGNTDYAKKMARHAMRLTILLFPFVTVVSGSAYGLVQLIFGSRFLETVPVLAVLMIGAWGLLVISVTTAILTSAGKPAWTFALSGPMVLLAVGGHRLLIPRLGLLGASYVTAFFAVGGALAGILAVYRAWKIFPPWATLWKSAFISALVYGLSFLWPASGSFVCIKMLFLGAVIAFAYWRLGEFGLSEINLIRALFQRSEISEQNTIEVS